MPSVLLTESLAVELGAQEPWPADVKLYQPYDVEQILLPDNANCLAVQAFLKMCGLDFQIENRSNAEFMSPSGRVPFIKCGAFVVSELDPIIAFVGTKGISLTSSLDSTQKADMRAYMSLVNTVLVNAELYVTWCDNATLKEVTRPRYGSVYPWPLNHVLCWQKRNQIIKKLSILGWAQKSLDEVYNEVEACCNALSERLDNKKYFFGSSPTDVDALVYSHLLLCLVTSLPSCRLYTIVQSYPTLVKFVLNIDEVYFKRRSKFICCGDGDDDGGPDDQGSEVCKDPACPGQSETQGPGDVGARPKQPHEASCRTCIAQRKKNFITVLPVSAIYTPFPGKFVPKMGENQFVALFDEQTKMVEEDGIMMTSDKMMMDNLSTAGDHEREVGDTDSDSDEEKLEPKKLGWWSWLFGYHDTSEERTKKKKERKMKRRAKTVMMTGDDSMEVLSNCASEASDKDPMVIAFPSTSMWPTKDLVRSSGCVFEQGRTFERLSTLIEESSDSISEGAPAVTAAVSIVTVQPPKNLVSTSEGDTGFDTLRSDNNEPKASSMVSPPTAVAVLAGMGTRRHLACIDEGDPTSSGESLEDEAEELNSGKANKRKKQIAQLQDLSATPPEGLRDALIQSVEITHNLKEEEMQVKGAEQGPAEDPSEASSQASSQPFSQVISQAFSKVFSQVISKAFLRVPSQATSHTPLEVPSEAFPQVPTASSSEAPSEFSSQVPSETSSQVSLQKTSSQGTSQTSSLTFSPVRAKTSPYVSSQVHTQVSSQDRTQPSSQDRSQASSQVRTPASLQVRTQTSSQVSSRTCSQMSLRSCSRVSSRTCSQVSSRTSSQVSSQVCSRTCLRKPSRTWSRVSSQICSHMSSHTSSQVSSRTCSQVSSRTCSQVSSRTCSQVSSRTCSQVSSRTCSQLSLRTCSQVSSRSCSPASTETSLLESSKAHTQAAYQATVHCTLFPEKTPVHAPAATLPAQLNCSSSRPQITCRSSRSTHVPAICVRRSSSATTSSCSSDTSSTCDRHQAVIIERAVRLAAELRRGCVSLKKEDGKAANEGKETERKDDQSEREKEQALGKRDAGRGRDVEKDQKMEGQGVLARNKPQEGQEMAKVVDQREKIAVNYESTGKKDVTKVEGTPTQRGDEVDQHDENLENTAAGKEGKGTEGRATEGSGLPEERESLISGTSTQAPSVYTEAVVDITGYSVGTGSLMSGAAEDSVSTLSGVVQRQRSAESGGSSSSSVCSGSICSGSVHLGSRCSRSICSGSVCSENYSVLIQDNDPARLDDVTSLRDRLLSASSYMVGPGKRALPEDIVTPLAETPKTETDGTSPGPVASPSHPEPPSESSPQALNHGVVQIDGGRHEQLVHQIRIPPEVKNGNLLPPSTEGKNDEEVKEPCQITESLSFTIVREDKTGEEPVGSTPSSEPAEEKLDEPCQLTSAPSESEQGRQTFDRLLIEDRSGGKDEVREELSTESKKDGEDEKPDQQIKGKPDEKGELTEGHSATKDNKSSTEVKIYKNYGETDPPLSLENRMNEKTQKPVIPSTCIRKLQSPHNIISVNLEKPALVKGKCESPVSSTSGGLLSSKPRFISRIPIFKGSNLLEKIPCPSSGKIKIKSSCQGKTGEVAGENTVGQSKISGSTKAGGTVTSTICNGVSAQRSQVTKKCSVSSESSAVSDSASVSSASRKSVRRPVSSRWPPGTQSSVCTMSHSSLCSQQKPMTFALDKDKSLSGSWQSAQVTAKERRLTSCLKRGEASTGSPKCLQERTFWSKNLTEKASEVARSQSARHRAASTGGELRQIRQGNTLDQPQSDTTRKSLQTKVHTEVNAPWPKGRSPVCVRRPVDLSASSVASGVTQHMLPLTASVTSSRRTPKTTVMPPPKTIPMTALTTSPETTSEDHPVTSLLQSPIPAMDGYQRLCTYHIHKRLLNMQKHLSSVVSSTEESDCTSGDETKKDTSKVTLNTAPSDKQKNVLPVTFNTTSANKTKKGRTKVTSDTTSSDDNQKDVTRVTLDATLRDEKEKDAHRITFSATSDIESRKHMAGFPSDVTSSDENEKDISRVTLDATLSDKKEEDARKVTLSATSADKTKKVMTKVTSDTTSSDENEKDVTRVTLDATLSDKKEEDARMVTLSATSADKTKKVMTMVTSDTTSSDENEKDVTRVTLDAISSDEREKDARRVTLSATSGNKTKKVITKVTSDTTSSDENEKDITRVTLDATSSDEREKDTCRVTFSASSGVKNKKDMTRVTLDATSSDIKEKDAPGVPWDITLSDEERGVTGVTLDAISSNEKDARRVTFSATSGAETKKDTAGIPSDTTSSDENEKDITRVTLDATSSDEREKDTCRVTFSASSGVKNKKDMTRVTLDATSSDIKEKDAPGVPLDITLSDEERGVTGVTLDAISSNEKDARRVTFSATSGAETKKDTAGIPSDTTSSDENEKDITRVTLDATSSDEREKDTCRVTFSASSGVKNKKDMTRVTLDATSSDIKEKDAPGVPLDITLSDEERGVTGVTLDAISSNEKDARRVTFSATSGAETKKDTAGIPSDTTSSDENEKDIRATLDATLSDEKEKDACGVTFSATAGVETKKDMTRVSVDASSSDEREKDAPRVTLDATSSDKKEEDALSATSGVEKEKDARRVTFSATTGVETKKDMAGSRSDIISRDENEKNMPWDTLDVTSESKTEKDVPGITLDINSGVESQEDVSIAILDETSGIEAMDKPGVILGIETKNDVSSVILDITSGKGTEKDVEGESENDSSWGTAEASSEKDALSVTEKDLAVCSLAAPAKEKDVMLSDKEEKVEDENPLQSPSSENTAVLNLRNDISSCVMKGAMKWKGRRSISSDVLSTDHGYVASAAMPKGSIWKRWKKWWGRKKKSSIEDSSPKEVEPPKGSTLASSTSEQLALKASPEQTELPSSVDTLINAESSGVEGVNVEAKEMCDLSDMSDSDLSDGESPSLVVRMAQWQRQARSRNKKRLRPLSRSNSESPVATSCYLSNVEQKTSEEDSVGLVDERKLKKKRKWRKKKSRLAMESLVEEEEDEEEGGVATLGRQEGKEEDDGKGKIKVG